MTGMEVGGYMANILQVTTPNLNTDNRNILNPQDPKNNAANPAIHNPIDPTRVVRADGRDGEQTGNTSQNGMPNIIDYESNYGAFIKGLGEGGELAGIMERLLFTDMAGIKESSQAEVSALIERFLMSVRMDSPQDLFDFLQGQRELQARFTGLFFDKMRSLLSQNPSDGLRDSVLQFLKGYNDFSSGEHLLLQMQSLTDDIEHLLLRSYRESFRELADSLNWEAPNGETQQNTALLNNRMIPFLSSYISRTHDYGAVREATMHLIFHAVRYQNGELKKLFKRFNDMVTNRDFSRLFKGDPKEGLKSLLKAGFDQKSIDKEVEKLLTEGAENPEDVEEFSSESEKILAELKKFQAERETEKEGSSQSLRGTQENPQSLREMQEESRFPGELSDETDRELNELKEDVRKELIADKLADKLNEAKGEIQEGQINKPNLLGPKQASRPMLDFADGFSSLLLKGANGQAGLENVQQFYTIMNGMLINESVYLPLLHFILPFQYEDNNVMSEMWVDPDAKKDQEEGGRRIKLFLKFDIQNLGKFELLMILQDRETKLQLLVPPQLAKQEKQIQSNVTDILKKNGMRVSQLVVRERVRDRRVDEVFSEIREKERTINVRI